MPRGRSGHQRRRDRMFAAEGHQELARIHDGAGRAVDACHRAFHRSMGKIHLGQRVNAAGVNIHAKLFVPQLHLGRRQDEFPGTVAGALHV